MIMKMVVHKEIDVMAVISEISLRRLIEGGAAIFTDENINHHIDMVGRNDSIPFIKKRLRV